MGTSGCPRGSGGATEIVVYMCSGSVIIINVSVISKKYLEVGVIPYRGHTRNTWLGAS